MKLFTTHNICKIYLCVQYTVFKSNSYADGLMHYAFDDLYSACWIADCVIKPISTPNKFTRNNSCSEIHLLNVLQGDQSDLPAAVKEGDLQQGATMTSEKQ